MDETTKRIIELERVCSVYEAKISILNDVLENEEIEAANRYEKRIKEGGDATYNPSFPIKTVKTILGLPESETAREIIYKSERSVTREDKPLVMPTIEA